MFGALLGSIAGPLIGGLLGGSSSGGGQQQQTVSKEPWAEAAPWLKQNLQTGQQLQNYYQQNPFNAQQQNAYKNLMAGTNYTNQMTPGLLQQMSQPQGFDRNNPQARPQAYSFAPQAQSLGFGPQTTQAPAMGDMNMTANPFANSGINQPEPPAAAYKQLTGADIVRLLNEERAREPIDYTH